MIAGFSSLQTAENRLVPIALGDRSPDWLLEVAPVSSPSPAVGVERVRMLFDAQGLTWPLRANLDEWPLDNDSVPAVLVRHAWQPGVAADPLPELLRVLKPGGLLISVSANPWHRKAWQELGKGAFMLPSWPHFQLLHARHSLELSVPARELWRGLVPGLSPALVLISRKPSRPARVTPIQARQPRLAAASATASLCRAA